jgi:hypothetical protein
MRGGGSFFKIMDEGLKYEKSLLVTMDGTV